MPLVLCLADEAEIGVHVQPLVAKGALVVFSDGFHLALVDEIRGLNCGNLLDFFQAVALQFPEGGGLSVLGKPLADMLGKGLHALEPFQHSLGELVIQFGQPLFLDRYDLDVEMAIAGG